MPEAPVTEISTSGASPTSQSYVLSGRLRLSTPQPIVALPCGSRSTSSVLAPCSVREAARLTLVVVLPTPPFWLATAMRRVMIASLPA